MSSFYQYSSLFVEGATTSVKAGARLCYISLAFTLLSGFGGFISNLLENRSDDRCKFTDYASYDASCMSQYLTSHAKDTPFRVFLRFFDVIASLLLIAVGNCLENVFRGSVMARVLSGTLLLASIMVVFEVSFASGLTLQLRDFVTLWKSTPYHAYLMSCYWMMDHAFDLIWTLDNMLYTYFLLILYFLTSEHDKFSAGYTKTALIGGVAGVVGFLFNVFNHTRSRFLRIIEMLSNLINSICLLVIIGWTGKALAGMEGDLVGKRGKKGRKGKKGKKSKHSRA